MSIEEGKRIEQWEEDRRFKIFNEAEGIGQSDIKETADVYYIQVDGTGVNDRKSKEWMECKVGACFSQRVLVSKGRNDKRNTFDMQPKLHHRKKDAYSI
ncbi:hypothetical protein JZK55_21710 [Dissulfurispira thermophila]|uniref:Uncharacterized protein n=2 Tax=root TaxID=1 RepID=A0A7G1H4U4_9BACT|nr:hypothetical protein [Dissulfurispira thermophila]BCB97249.1 hypothetical protein JZK55_21710 [Dissulfurispira thermophila]